MKGYCTAVTKTQPFLDVSKYSGVFGLDILKALRTLPHSCEHAHLPLEVEL